MKTTSLPQLLVLAVRPIILGPIALLIVGGSVLFGSDFAVGDAPAVTDITNANLTKRSANCADYATNYAARVEDVQRGIGFDALVKVSADETACTVASNAIPNHDFNATGRFAHVVSTQTQTYRVPANPQIADRPTPLTLRTDNAILLNGVKVDLLGAGCYGVGDGRIGCNDMAAPYRYDPVGKQKFGVDEHNAHTQPDGTYHYHGNPHALFPDNGDHTPAPSPVIGFAADGFPIFGSYFADGTTLRKAKSSYQLKAGKRNGGPGGVYDGTFTDDYQFVAGSGDLDACNGMTQDGVYGYFVTDGYPYILGCFVGTPDASFNKRGPGGGRGQGANGPRRGGPRDGGFGRFGER